MSDHLTVFLQINTVKYDTDREITKIYENLQIVWTHFLTDMLLFINIQSTLNIYWFISIRIRCQRIQTNNYLFTFDYWWYSVRYSMSDTKGNFKLFALTYFWVLGVKQNCNDCKLEECTSHKSHSSKCLNYILYFLNVTEGRCFIIFMFIIHCSCKYVNMKACKLNSSKHKAVIVDFCASA